MLHVLTHSFPYRRSVDLHVVALQVVADARLPGGLQLDAVVGHQGPRALAGAASATSFPLKAATPFKSPRLKPLLQVLRRPGRILTCPAGAAPPAAAGTRSEEHTSELQSLMRISYAVFCVKKKQKTHTTTK